MAAHREREMKMQKARKVSCMACIVKWCFEICLFNDVLCCMLHGMKGMDALASLYVDIGAR